jgi:hypothetical protein
MIGRLILGLALACAAGAASAQESCTLYKVNTSLLNISKDAGGAIYTDALFDGDTACVTRRANVAGAEWAYIAHKVEGGNRTPVEGWAALQYLQPTAAAAGAPAAPPPPAVSFNPPPAVAVGPGAAPAAAAPASPNATAAMRADEILRFDQPIPFGPYPLNGKSLKELIDTVPMFAPIEGLDESLWKKNCRECHQWSQSNLCQQAATYLQTPRYALRVPHPFGGTIQIALMRWAKSGCQ